MFDWSVLGGSQAELIDAFYVTLALSLLSGVLSFLAGLLLCAARLKARGAVAAVLTAYVELMRNTPLLITLYLAYFGLPMIGLQIPTFTCVVVVLVMQHAVFVSEVFRGGFLAVPASQIEAGKAIGMTPLQIFRVVQLPQVWAASVPALISALMFLIHDTSLGAAISLVDFTMAAKVIAQRTAASFEPFVAIAVFYSVLSWVLSRVGSYLERRSHIAR